MNKKSFKEIERTTQTMGMAASQARLLTLTARLSDNELRSQTINNAKMRLAAQSSQASEAYINALNNATLKFTNYDETGAAHTQPLTYNALTAYSSYNTQYGLTNTSGQLLVSEDEARIFANANGDLNKYLKAHGLEYTTTYFEKISNKENPDYPEPFNYVTTDQLQSWYEAYGSYENSVEVEKYKEAYSKYNSAKTSLYHSLSDPLDKYLGVTGQGSEKTDGGYKYDEELNKDRTQTTIHENFNALLAAYKNGANSYSYNNATTLRLMLGNGSAIEKTMENIMKKYTHNTTPESINVKSSTTITENPDSTLSFEFGGAIINMDKNFNVNYVKLATESSNSDEDNQGTKYIYGGVVRDFDSELKFVPFQDAEGNGPDITTFLNNFALVEYDEDGTTEFNRTQLTAIDKEKGTVAITDSYFTEAGMREQIEDLNLQLLQVLRENIDYSKFGKYLIQNDKDITAAIKEKIEAFEKTKNEFLKVIFKDIENTKYQFPIENDKGEIQYSQPMSVIEAIDGGTLMINDLLDENYTLWLANNIQDENGEKLTEENSFMTENFKSVIKTFIVEEVIKETGTPNYAWVDANDTGNTGNADAKAQWYTNLFKRMQKGYKALENGLATSAQWLEYAFESGIVMLEQVDKSFNWQSLEFKTCTRITEETDDAAVAKAEAEYTRAMNDIKAKDNIFDIQLKNIDTEHNSLQTEFESIQKVMNKNIERTFKFSQNG